HLGPEALAHKKIIVVKLRDVLDPDLIGVVARLRARHAAALLVNPALARIALGNRLEFAVLFDLAMEDEVLALLMKDKPGFHVVWMVKWHYVVHDISPLQKKRRQAQPSGASFLCHVWG